jgi:hypothetical protein
MPSEVCAVVLTLRDFYSHGSVVVKALCYKPEGCGSISDEVIFKFT